MTIATDNNIRPNKYLNIGNSIEVWKRWITKQNRIQKEIVGVARLPRNKTWITTDILQMMKERRKNKYKKLEYQRINKFIWRTIRERKQEWLHRKCEIETLVSA